MENIWTEVDDESLKNSPAAELLRDGLAAKWRGDYRHALQNYRDALAYAQQNKQELFVVIANLNIGNIFREWRSFDLAWVHYANAGKASSSLSSDRLKSDIANAMAGLAWENEDAATAFEGYSEAIEYAEKAADKARIATLKHNMASVLQRQKEPHLAISLYKEAFETGVGHREVHLQARTKCQIGTCWFGDTHCPMVLRKPNARGNLSTEDTAVRKKIEPLVYLGFCGSPYSLWAKTSTNCCSTFPKSFGGSRPN